jgi:hypothetical protein
MRPALRGETMNSAFRLEGTSKSERFGRIRGPVLPGSDGWQSGQAPQLILSKVHSKRDDNDPAARLIPRDEFSRV